MIKSILVVLDDSQSSLSAKKLGIQLTQTYKASLTGIGILDKSWIDGPQAIPLGGASFKIELEAQLMLKEREHVYKMEKAFIDQCKDKEISCSIIDAMGIPVDEIGTFSTEHDIIVIGKEANFHFIPIEGISPSVQEFLKDVHRPLVLTSKKLPNQDSSNILVAYDGTFASSRAAHMAILLGLLKNKTIHVANVSSDKKEARDLVNRVASLCENHGLKSHIHPIESSKKPSIELLNLMKSIKPSALVTGAYGHRGVAYFFKGSCIQELLRSAEVPIFVYH
ncbi:MAG: universal stress protein [Flavobacteriales bacterium]|nr:universal stress protein [Flavobacteriales bacterium]